MLGKMYFKVIPMSIKVNWVYTVFCIPIGYLVVRTCEDMKMNNNDIPIHTLLFRICAIWPHSVKISLKEGFKIKKKLHSGLPTISLYLYNVI